MANDSKKLVLSNDQVRAMQLFEDFVGNDNKIFILNGYAGTGKTTLVKEMIEWLKNNDKSYCLLASTGRAAQILSSKAKGSASTVHKCIYAYEDFNQDIDQIIDERQHNGVDSKGQLYLNFGLVTVRAKRQVIYIIDEASMISDEKDTSSFQASFGSGCLLHDLLLHDPMGKFVFVGDACQLPPINQDVSPALSTGYFEYTFGYEAQVATLTEIKRQKSGNDIVVAAQKLRRLYEKPQNYVWAKFPLRGFRNIHLLSSQAVLVHEYIDRVRKNGYTDSVLVCKTNKQCDMLTKIIRPALGLNSPQLQKGDLLLVTQNNSISGMMNGDQVVVDEVKLYERRAGVTFLNVSFHEVMSGENFSQLMIAEVLYGNQTNLSMSQQKELFVDFAIRMRHEHIKPKSDEFNRRMVKDPYLNALRAVYGFALTCHKTQGGEWNNVFLDLPRSFAREKKPYVYQWMYTALTRAGKDFYLVDDFYIDGYK